MEQNNTNPVELAKQSELIKSMNSLKLRRLKRLRSLNEDRYTYGSRKRKGFNFKSWYSSISENSKNGKVLNAKNLDEIEKNLQLSLEEKENSYREFLVSRYPLSQEKVETLLNEWRDSLFPKNKIKELDENRVNIKSGSYRRRMRKSS